MASYKRDDVNLLTFYLQENWTLDVESFRILDYSADHITIADDNEDMIVKMTRTAAAPPSVGPLAKIFPKCPKQLDMTLPSLTKSQERKCTYRIFFHMHKNKIKRALNDFLALSMMCASEFTQALSEYTDS